MSKHRGRSLLSGALWFLPSLPGSAEGAAPCVCSPGGTAEERVSEHPSWLDLNWFFLRSALLVTGTLSVLRSEHWYFFLSSVFLCFSAVYLPWVCCVSSLPKSCVFFFFSIGIWFSLQTWWCKKWSFLGKAPRGDLITFESTLTISAFVHHLSIISESQ